MQWTILVYLLALTVAVPASAFQLRPEVKNGEKLLRASDDAYWRMKMNVVGYWGIEQFTNPVHEIITNRIYGCGSDDGCAVTVGNRFMQPAAPMAVLAGVRWNDNPPFRLSDTSLSGCKNVYVQLPMQGSCWASVFSDGKKKAEMAKGAVLYKFQSNKPEQYSMLLRSHFGDLQFLHAMASRPGERAGETADNIMMWAEFVWRITTSEYSRGTTIAEASVDVPLLLDFFDLRDTVQSILFKGEAGYNKDYRDFAFGTLLHLVQDSYSEAHMARQDPDGRLCEKTNYDRPGRAVRYYTYVGQNSRNHGRKDELIAVTRQLSNTPTPNLVDVGQAIKEMRDKHLSWNTVEPYFDCLFRTAQPMTEADKGPF
ncbi:hypothetical protein [Pseudomonas retamae]|uniref:Uncharacterized protein n=1 Tax=Pseudomonas retamae TaxID=702110 RepID=A0ABW7DIJ5_9PSED